MTPILGPPTMRWEVTATWTASRGGPRWWCALTETAWQAANATGVQPEVLWSQACKEVGFGKFGGTIDASYRNPCGLKTRHGGANTDPVAHQRFDHWLAGFLAHADHLALYAGATGYPRPLTYDPRHFGHLTGLAPTVEELSGRWAPSSDYGQSVVRDYLDPLRAWSR